MIKPADILNFWFSPQSKANWFKRSMDFDATIRARFLAAWYQARAEDFARWADESDGALALIILLDQFPRNMFRASPLAFASDAQALDLARAAIARDFDQAQAADRRRFFYLPFEHSEDLADQKACVQFFKDRTQDPEGLDYAQRHLAVIERFGRFPHRNIVLGRLSTAEEEAYLREPGSGF